MKGRRLVGQAVFGPKLFGPTQHRRTLQKACKPLSKTSKRYALIPHEIELNKTKCLCTESNTKARGRNHCRQEAVRTVGKRNNIVNRS